MGKWTGHYVESCDITKWVVRWNDELEDGTYNHTISILCDLKDADGQVVAQDKENAVLANTADRLTTKECLDLLQDSQVLNDLTIAHSNAKTNLADETDAELTVVVR